MFSEWLILEVKVLEFGEHEFTFSEWLFFLVVVLGEDEFTFSDVETEESASRIGSRFNTL